MAEQNTNADAKVATELTLTDLPALERLGRMGAMGLLSGAVAGVIVGGIGSRIVMRILAVVNNELSGIPTENGNVVGEITVGGTLGLLIFGGIFAGIIGGLFYVLIRRWVPGTGLWKGLAFGIILFLLVGGVVIDKDNIDFELIGPSTLAVSLFAFLFPLYGLVLSPMMERFDPYVPPLFLHPVGTVIGYVLLGGLCVVGLVLDVVALNAIL